MLGYLVEHLDGDVMRQSFGNDLGFSRKDRDENVRRLSVSAQRLMQDGCIVIVSAISPYREERQTIRDLLGQDFIEIYVNAPLSVCESRDVKGLFKKAREGLLTNFTGVNDPYEEPLHPEVECRTDLETVQESADKVLKYVMEWLARGQ
jgi:adenylylsulfate kinase